MRVLRTILAALTFALLPCLFALPVGFGGWNNIVLLLGAALLLVGYLGWERMVDKLQLQQKGFFWIVYVVCLFLTHAGLYAFGAIAGALNGDAYWYEGLGWILVFFIWPSYLLLPLYHLGKIWSDRVRKVSAGKKK